MSGHPTEQVDRVAQAILQMYAADTGCALPSGEADRLARAALDAATPPPDLADLGERLLRASAALFDLEATASHEGNWKHAMRLKAKRSGVELALSYLVEAERVAVGSVGERDQ